MVFFFFSEFPPRVMAGLPFFIGRSVPFSLPLRILFPGSDHHQLASFPFILDRFVL